MALPRLSPSAPEHASGASANQPLGRRWPAISRFRHSCRTASISPSECTCCSAARLAGSKSEVNTTPSIRAIARCTAVSRSAASWCGAPGVHVSWPPQSSCSNTRVSAGRSFSDGLAVLRRERLGSGVASPRSPGVAASWRARFCTLDILSGTSTTGAAFGRGGEGGRCKCKVTRCQQ